MAQRERESERARESEDAVMCVCRNLMQAGEVADEDVSVVITVSTTSGFYFLE